MVSNPIREHSQIVPDGKGGFKEGSFKPYKGTLSNLHGIRNWLEIMCFKPYKGTLSNSISIYIERKPLGFKPYKGTLSNDGWVSRGLMGG